MKKVSSVGFWTNEEFGGSKRGIWLWKCGGNQIIWVGKMQGTPRGYGRRRAVGLNTGAVEGQKKKGMPVGDGRWLQAGGR